MLSAQIMQLLKWTFQKFKIIDISLVCTQEQDWPMVEWYNISRQDTNQYDALTNALHGLKHG